MNPTCLSPCISLAYILSLHNESIERACAVHAETQVITLPAEFRISIELFVLLTLWFVFVDTEANP